MRYWVTKYALTKGVFLSHEGCIIGQYFKEDTRFGLFLKIDRDAFESREAAEADAGARALRKIHALEKQLAKIRKLAETPRFREG